MPLNIKQNPLTPLTNAASNFMNRIDPPTQFPNYAAYAGNQQPESNDYEYPAYPVRYSRYNIANVAPRQQQQQGGANWPAPSPYLREDDGEEAWNTGNSRRNSRDSAILLADNDYNRQENAGTKSEWDAQSTAYTHAYGNNNRANPMKGYSEADSEFQVGMNWKTPNRKLLWLCIAIFVAAILGGLAGAGVGIYNAVKGVSEAVSSSETGGGGIFVIPIPTVNVTQSWTRTTSSSASTSSSSSTSGSSSSSGSSTSTSSGTQSSTTTRLPGEEESTTTTTTTTSRSSSTTQGTARTSINVNVGVTSGDAADSADSTAQPTRM